MIEMLEGRLGGGKTYMSVCNMVAALRSGRRVVSNVRLSLDRVCDLVGRDVSGLYSFVGEDHEAFWGLHRLVGLGDPANPVLVVWDEIQLWLGSREWAETRKRAPWLMPWLTQSRKLGIDMVFISQDRKNVDSQVRRLLQFVWKCRDLSYLSKRLLGFECPNWCRFLRVQTDYSGVVLGWQVVPLRLEVARCYETAALLKPLDLGV